MNSGDAAEWAVRLAGRMEEWRRVAEAKAQRRAAFKAARAMGLRRRQAQRAAYLAATHLPEDLS